MDSLANLLCPKTMCVGGPVIFLISPKSGVLQVQYHGITDGANLDTWRGMSYQTVLTPDEQNTGKVIYPYEKAR